MSRAAVLAAALTMTGCLLLAPAAGGQTGTTPAPSPPAVSRSPVESELLDRLSAVPALRDLEVQVVDGRAILTGVALTEEASKAAERTATEVPGVRRVDNRLEPPASVEQRLEP
ncbi:MAG: BON domain-containing protein, partial [Acidobacteria bacterium]|nr:BON domain-containing protein [Acidobacteriota bacterium]